ncbi:hypothetical protein [Chitinophaga pinensis]|uniref:Uncharacterized protein n=1 Tax=Chitinophaga pinensis (strain ATCC 43595 / DSM 2588 / LMG 13176 / NBRC 15968 / NCIMB 11800 / UQM 2034) TaxID=485918 RepID=A0A979GBY2_CHIPD|nr:hypothetical protein [Chitinophaga pinensis]ACU64499.1 hypothetical protein Cpin_7098 [Chitinophaga pinensis DSM 2588]
MSIDTISKSAIIFIICLIGMSLTSSSQHKVARCNPCKDRCEVLYKILTDTSITKHFRFHENLNDPIRVIDTKKFWDACDLKVNGRPVQIVHDSSLLKNMGVSDYQITGVQREKKDEYYIYFYYKMTHGHGFVILKSKRGKLFSTNSGLGILD